MTTQTYNTQTQDLFFFIKCNNISIETKEDLKNAMTLWMQSGVEFYHRMTKTNDGKIVAEKMYNDYLTKKGL